jgi:hypothetical protein
MEVRFPPAPLLLVSVMGGKQTFAQRGCGLHTGGMQSISFVPSEGDLIAANRLHFWSSMMWKQTVQSYVLGGLLFAVIGTLFVLEESGWVIMVGAALGFLFWSLLLVSILALNYMLISRRSRHAFRQMKTLQSETYINWSPQRIQLRSAQGSSDFD